MPHYFLFLLRKRLLIESEGALSSFQSFQTYRKN